MYGWIWRHLPGPTWLRVIEAAVLIGLAVVALFTWVFPWAAPLLPFNQLTVGE